MKALYNFIVEPVGERYNNVKKIDGNTLLLNTELQNHNYSNRIAKVIAVPSAIKTDIKVGDEIIVHHNVFRRFKDIRGVEKNSKSYYEDNIYFVNEDQVFAYKRNQDWQSCSGFNFIKPIKETKVFSLDSEKPAIGVLYFKDPSLKDLDKGNLVGFRPGAEYEFVIGKNRLYRVPTNSITIKYEYKGDEEEYNPSWA
tara:strand:+ start:517 stop:1107 length:591 start_codon:yes stop_codon:yes gene_type:complete